jgi:hypothetical protein
MIDLFVLLTPLLLLGVVALLGFAGCVFHAGSEANSLTVSPSSGTVDGGTMVTISADEGTFGSNVTAAFGNAPAVPATYVIGSDYAQVTATTPPQQSAGAVDVTVDYLDPSGQSGSIETDQAFTYNLLPVTPLQPPALTNQPVGNSSVSATLNAFAAPNRLVVVTVQWGGAGTLTLTSAPTVTFNRVEMDPFTLGPAGQVATFYAFADLSGGITITATLGTPTALTDLSLLVSAYDNVDAGGPVLATNQQNKFSGAAPALQFGTSSLAVGDLIYAVAVERGGGGASKGTWTPGANLTELAGQGGFIMLEYEVLQQADITAGQVNLTATDATAPAAGLWYLFAMALKHV